MPDDNGSYLRRLAKNRLKGGGSYSTSTATRDFKRVSRKLANENTQPQPTPKSAVNPKPTTGWNTKVPPGNMRGPKAIRRSHEAPVNNNRFRKMP